MASSVLVYHVIGDLTLGKPELLELYDTDTVETAARAIANSSEGAITVWSSSNFTRPTTPTSPSSSSNRVHNRVDVDDDAVGVKKGKRVFVGMLNSLDIVTFMASRTTGVDSSSDDQVRALKSPISEMVIRDPSLLKEVDPGTRLIDALDMMKQGVRRLLVRKSNVWKGMSKRFSVIYYGKWLKNLDTYAMANTSQPSSSSQDNSKYCCLSREDVIRFLIGCLGGLAPIPLSPISLLNAVTPHYSVIEASSPALEAARINPHDPSAVAVIERNQDGSLKIIGEISAYKLWKCDHIAAAWAMANLSAGQFVMGAEDSSGSTRDLPEFSMTQFGEITSASNLRPRKFSSRSIGFYSKPTDVMTIGGLRSMYRGRSAPLTCKTTSSLAAVMAQMLSHRATHVWVTEEGSEDTLVGVVSYTDILQAVTRNPATINAVVPCS